MWAPLAPNRSWRSHGTPESPLYTPELLAAIDRETNLPTTGPDSVDRYNIKCPWCPVAVPVRQVARFHGILDQIDAVGGGHPELFVDGVLSIPLASLAARLKGSGTR